MTLLSSFSAGGDAWISARRKTHGFFVTPYSKVEMHLYEYWWVKSLTCVPQTNEAMLIWSYSDGGRRHCVFKILPEVTKSIKTK